MGLKLNAAILGSLAVGVAFSQADKAANYQKDEAEIIQAEFDCFVAKGNRHIVERDSETRAYMDCDLAPLAAMMHDFKPEDITTRTKAIYQYVSAIDGQTYTKNFTKSGFQQADYAVGSKIQVYLHKTKPEKSRF
ncbi:MAG: hypothetical protein AAF296_13135 [Pseudomonadota bacterium]